MVDADKICITGVAQSQHLIELLQIAAETEPEAHIKENMIGLVPWSLVSQLASQTRYADPGFITSCIIDGRLAGICGCEVNDAIFKPGFQFGMRLWIHPQYRAIARLPSALIAPQLQTAAELNLPAWTSFNNDRSAMLRMIKIRAADDDARVRQIWTGFEFLSEPVLLNNTVQHIAFKPAPS